MSTIGTVTGSERLIHRARQSIAGGDSSTMRVLPIQIPLVAAEGKGSRLWDVDGREYIDLNSAYGPLLLGHRHPRIVAAVTQQVENSGSLLGFPTEITVRVAEKVKRLYPSIELLRFANSGTEAIATAVRLARVKTGRPKLILFEGHYHGWSEGVFHRYHAPLGDLPSGGYGPALRGTEGMTDALGDVIVVRWNDLALLERVLAEHGPSVAGILMEPVMGNAGVIAPKPGFLLGARELARTSGALLIFDEVITGMRVAAGGAQERYEVSPDITVLSKAVGGGYPVAAFGASAEIMQPIVDGTLFHGGVFSGNALVMAAAEAVLDEVLEKRAQLYRELESTSAAFVEGVSTIMCELGVPFVIHNVGPMISIFITKNQVAELAGYRDVRRHGDFERYVRFQQHLQRSGVYVHPNMFEPIYLSTAHTHTDVEMVLQRVADAARASLVG